MIRRISINSEHFLKELKKINECIQDAKLERDYDLKQAPQGTKVDFTDVALNNLKSNWISLRQLETEIKACTQAAVIMETFSKVKQKFYGLNSPALKQIMKENAQKSTPLFDFLPLPQKKIETRRLSQTEITSEQNKTILDQLHETNSQDHEMLRTKSKIIKIKAPPFSCLTFCFILLIALLLLGFIGGMLYSKQKGEY